MTPTQSSDVDIIVGRRNAGQTEVHTGLGRSTLGIRVPTHSSQPAAQPNLGKDIDNSVSTGVGWRRVARRILWIEPFWILVVAPSVLFPGRFWDRNIQAVLVVLLFVFWPFRLFVRPLDLVRSPVGLAAIGLAAWLPVTIYVSGEPARSVEWVGYTALGIALFAALVDWPPATRSPIRIAWALIVFGVALALIGPLLVGKIPDKFALLMMTRPTVALAAAPLGETVNPNVLAGALAVIVPVASALAIGNGARVPVRLLAAATALIMIGVLIWTQCRGAYFATFISLAVLGVALLSGRTKRLFLIAVAIAGFVVSAWSAATFSSALADSQSELARRIQIWHRALMTMRDAPLAGIGFSQFDVVIPRLYPYDMLASPPPPHAHNLPLQIGVDMGLIGLLIMVTLWASVGRSLLGMWRSHGIPSMAVSSDFVRTATAGAAAAFTAMLVHGLVDAVLWSSKVAFLPWILYSFVVCLSLMVRPTDARRAPRVHATKGIGGS